MEKLRNKLITLISLNLLLLSCVNGQHGLRKGVNACQIAKQQDLQFAYIKDGFSEMVKLNNDTCIIALLDTLTARAIRFEDKQYLELLIKLYSKSDGYVSEYFLEIGRKLFYLDFKKLLSYGSEIKSKHISQLIVWALSMELSEAEDEKKTRDKIHNFIESQLGSGAYTKDEVLYIKTIESRIHPELFN